MDIFLRIHKCFRTNRFSEYPDLLASRLLYSDSIPFTHIDRSGGPDQSVKIDDRKSMDHLIVINPWVDIDLYWPIEKQSIVASTIN